MSEAVVDALEFIGVHKQEDRLLEVELLQKPVVTRAVEQPCQLVGLGLVGKAVL